MTDVQIPDGLGGFRSLAPIDPSYTTISNLFGKASTALTNNQTFLAIASPTNAQIVSQVQALTRQVDALIKLAIGSLADTAGT